MPTTYLAVLALALLGVGGPLLLVGLAGTVGGVAIAGVAAVWLGLLLATATVLQVLRIDHQMARSRGKRLARVEKQLDKVATTDALGTAVEASQREILRTVDARILGLYENLRDAAGASRRGPGAGPDAAP